MYYKRHLENISVSLKFCVFLPSESHTPFCTQESPCYYFCLSSPQPHTEGLPCLYYFWPNILVFSVLNQTFHFSPCSFLGFYSLLPHFRANSPCVVTLQFYINQCHTTEDNEDLMCITLEPTDCPPPTSDYPILVSWKSCFGVLKRYSPSFILFFVVVSLG